jgi:uncharacterized membrane protein YphA (DoxX/SURF4 family)
LSAWRHALIARVLAIALGLVFVYASHDKIWKRLQQKEGQPAPTAVSGPAEFARVIYRYQVIGPNATLPPQVPNLLAATLPWIELIAGLLLIVGVWRREAALLCGLLLLAFILAVGSTLWRGIDIQNCGCFSLASAGRRAGFGLIAADAAMFAAALFVAGVRPQRSRP